MKLNRTDSPITKGERLQINENWSILENNFNNVVSKISDEAFKEVVDNAKLNWLSEYVDTYEDIATMYPNPEEGDTTMARHASADFPTDPDDKRDAGVVWRFDGTEWQPIQQIDVSAFNQAFDDLNKEIGSVQSNLTDHVTNLDNPHQVNPDQIGASHYQEFDIRSYDNDIQSALTACYDAGGGIVFVPDGLYEITETLEIYANTRLRLSHNAELKRAAVFSPMLLNGQKGVDSFTSYNGNGNIMVEGGIINGNGSTFQTRASEIMFAHAENIIIKEVTFLDNYDSHFIEFNSIRNGKILNNSFEGQVMDETDARFPEMVQIDLATTDGFPHFGEADNTPCTDILIEGNYFNDGIRGVGTHSAIAGEQSVHKRINISNNVFKYLEAQSVRAMDWWTSVISNNIMEHVGSGIEVRAEENPIHYLDITNNTIKNTSRLDGILFTNNEGNGTNIYNCVIEGNIIAHPRGNGRGIYARYLNDSIIANNRIVSPTEVGIFVRSNGSRVVIKGNSIHNAGKEGIYLYDGMTRAVIEGNLLYDSGRNGIRLSGCSHSMVVDNYIYFARVVDGSGGHCIYVHTETQYSNITGNKCVGVSDGSQIIYLSGTSSYNLISGNHTSAGGHAGIYATSSCKYVFVTGNLCVGNDIVATGTGSQTTNNLIT